MNSKGNSESEIGGSKGVSRKLRGCEPGTVLEPFARVTLSPAT